jgi:hypothetical protein
LTASRDGADRLVITSRTCVAKYRDDSGLVQEVATGCRDKVAAESVLADLENRAEKVRGGIISTAHAGMIDQQGTLLADHLKAYLIHPEAEGTSRVHRDSFQRCLGRLARECGFRRLADLTRESLERWLVGRTREGMEARNSNLHRAAAMALCHWFVEAGRLRRKHPPPSCPSHPPARPNRARHHVRTNAR